MRVDLRAALEQAYEAGSYRDRIDYRAPCEPPLDREDQAWADEILRRPPTRTSLDAVNPE